MRYLKPLLSFALVITMAVCLISAKAKPSANVFYVEGKAEYLASGKTGWKNIKKGLSLYSGDSVKTYENASLDIAFDGMRENVINISSNSYVIVKLGDPEKMELIDGEMFTLIKNLPAGSTFEIRTPTAVCGARGTGWGARGTKDNTIVSGYEKNSYAKGLNKDGTPMPGETTIKQGTKTQVNKFQKPSALSNLTNRDYDKWNKWKDSLIDRLSGKRNKRDRLVKDLSQIQDKQERLEERRDEDRIRRRDEEAGAGTGSESSGDRYSIGE